MPLIIPSVVSLINSINSLDTREKSEKRWAFNNREMRNLMSLEITNSDNGPR